MLAVKELKEMEEGKLGGAIRAARLAQHISQEELAEMVSITPTHLKHIESEHRKPSLEVLWKLAYTLHLSLDALLYPEHAENNPDLSCAETLLRQCDKKQLHVIIATLEALLKP